LLLTEVDAADRANNSSRKEERVIVSWDSPKLSRMEELWRAKGVPAGTGPNEVPFVRVRRLEEMLKHDLSKEYLRELAASFATMPDEDHRTEFAGMLVCAMVELFVTSGDREGLVTLLAARYPSLVFPGYYTEHYVVSTGGGNPTLTVIDAYKPNSPSFRHDVEWALSHGFSKTAVTDKEDTALVETCVNWLNAHKDDPGMMGGKFSDPILILTDAYSRSKSRAVRNDISEAIRRAFTGSGVVGKGSDEFVANAVRWYAEHKDRLELNPDYNYNGLGAGDSTNPPALFKLKPPAKR
jgi:hypothetical protein